MTTPALQPELWAYTFSVDGVRTLDPRNYNVARDGVGFMNTVLVPGDASAVFQAQAVPHGTVTTTWFQSTDLKSRAPHDRLHPARVRGGQRPGTPCCTCFTAAEETKRHGPPWASPT